MLIIRMNAYIWGVRLAAQPKAYPRVQVSTKKNAKAFAVSTTDQCWDAIHAKDVRAFGASIRATFEAQVTMFPNMLTPAVENLIDKYRDKALGWKLSGGGVYLVLISDTPIENAIHPQRN